MSTLALPMTSPPSPKRSYDDAGLGYVDLENEDLDQKPTFSQQLSMPTGEGTAPQIPLIPSIETGPVTSSPLTSSLPPSSILEKPAKRVKLSAEDKEAKRIEKEAKDRQKAEEKARREEEKAKKDAEKAVKDEERRRAKEAKEEQARLKEEEKQRKEDEKMKKARSQLRLNAFFQQPTNQDSSLTGSPAKSPSKGDEASPLSSRRSSVAEINAIGSERGSRSASVQATPSKPRLPDYKRCFPEFFVKSHTVLALPNRFSCDVEGLSHAIRKLDETLPREEDDDPRLDHSFDNLLHLLTKKRRQPHRAVSLKEVIRSINGSFKNPIDLTNNLSKDKNPTEALRDIPIKFLKFAEDVRPPYIGTYSKSPTQGSISSLARKPLSRVRPDTNYDYDSEAEWEDPVDGEDLDSEGEEEDEDEDEEEMEGFLDDEEPNTIKRRPLLGDQEPICSGICWEGVPLSSNGSAPPDLDPYRIDILLENPCFPIDPFSTTYWASPPPEKASSTRIPSNQSTLMEPPRIPLSPVNRTNTLLKPPPPTTHQSTNKAPKAPKRFVDPEILDDFKEAVVGSDLTKMGLCEILKKKFPKQKKDAIRDTLEAVAERVGEKAVDKKWVLRSGV